MSTNKIASSITIVALLISMGIIFTKDFGAGNNTNLAGSNIEIKDGVQYVTINARGGYFPRISTATAGIPTKLIVKTDGTYDCSSYIVINSLNYKNVLPPSGETVVDLGNPTSGKSLNGTCGMGMYRFEIDFK